MGDAQGLGDYGPTNVGDEECMKLRFHPCTIYLSPRLVYFGVYVSLPAKSGARSRGMGGADPQVHGVSVLHDIKSCFMLNESVLSSRMQNSTMNGPR
jgi:hypothetical protein